MGEIKPIETVYKGYRFRSRLEARWAVFFDALGIAWEYEKEGYCIDGVRYLPDFWLPQQRHFFEVKGDGPTEAEHQKCLSMTLAKTTAYNRIYLFAGSFPPEEPGISTSPFLGYTYVCGSCGNPWQKSAVWMECIFCGLVSIIDDIKSGALGLSCGCICQYVDYGKMFDALADQFRCTNRNGLFDKYIVPKLGSFDAWYDTPRLLAAYTAARQARFEYGESGKR